MFAIFQNWFVFFEIRINGFILFPNGGEISTILAKPVFAEDPIHD